MPELSAKRPTPWPLKMLKLVPRFFWLSLLRTAEYKFNLYTYLLLYSVNLFFFVFFWKSAGLPPVGEWKTEHLILLNAFAVLNFAMQEVLWSTGILDLLILEGDLLVVLSRPMPSYFGLVLRRMGAMAVFPALMGLGLILETLWSYRMDSSVVRLAGALSLCLLAAITLRAGMVFMCSFAFKLGKVNFLKSFFLGAREYSRLSLSILHPAMSGTLTFFIPAIMVATWPVEILSLRTPEECLTLLGAAIGLCLGWVLLASWFWTRGLKSYEGTGRWG